MSNLTDFIHTELYPRLFEVVDRAFPSMGFQPYRGGWASPCKLDGGRAHDGRKDKSVITRRQPYRVIEQGGESKDLLSLYMEQNGIVKPVEAVEKLCPILGLTLPPMEDSESYIAYKEKQDKLEEVALKMQRALYSDDIAKGTLNYLRQERGYSDEFIKWAGFGCVDSESKRELSHLFNYTNRDGQEVGLPYGVGGSYMLAIPYRVGGSIKGFVFRAISEPVTPKYKDAFISATASKRYHLFGLTGLNLSGDGERDRDITIVEGEIDALRASFEGVPNVVAASGGNISAEALQEAKRKGVKRVTLLFDTEETAEAQEAIDKKIERAIATINEVGLAPFVATFPYDGGKVDTDSYLRDHSKEELEAVILSATSGARWKGNRILWKFADGKPKGDTELHEAKRQIIELCNSRYTSPTDRSLILRSLATSTDREHFTEEALQQEADILKLAQDNDRQQQATIALAAEALNLAKDGKAAEALSVMAEKVAGVQDISKEATYSKLLNSPTAETIKHSFDRKPTGIKTPYAFETKEGMEQFRLPTGALTYICAPTSHGKSRMLENLALSLAKDEEEGAVLYFSYEEDNIAVIQQFLNMYADMYICDNNLRAISSYYRENTTRYFKGGVSVGRFLDKEKEFFSLLTTGKLRVYNKDYDSSTLIGAIRYIAKNIKVKAVFIDYIQLLHKRGFKRDRKEELTGICKDFMDLAIETSLPIVMAAQLNRSTLSPLDMAVQNISDATEIEQSANVVMLLWNSVVKPISSGQRNNSYYRSQNDRTLTEEASKLESRGFHIGTEGKLYVTLAKNRGGARNIDAILDFNQNTGVIKSNYSEPEPKPQGGQEQEEGYTTPF